MDQLNVEKKGIPTVTIVTTAFEESIKTCDQRPGGLGDGLGRDGTSHCRPQPGGDQEEGGEGLSGDSEGGDPVAGGEKVAVEAGKTGDGRMETAGHQHTGGRCHRRSRTG